MEWSVTFCDYCNSDPPQEGGRGYHEGACPAPYDGWSVLERSYTQKGMTLSSGYEIPARQATERAHLCPECHKDREAIDHYLDWTCSGYEAEPYREARDAFEAADEANWECEATEREAAA